ncbi:putative claudin-24 [Chanos chanos]|uniref:Claudin n=1 Tax=Chanos chanos TaxID=29144 RepID=A0A6J2WUC6_CHACN|nr:putative claudin-24 [Chanos chanos]
MSNPCTCALELLGMLVGAVAWFCSLSTTLMSQWMTLSTELLAAESYEKGLWETCVVQDVGGMECRPYDTLLGLPQDIKLARIFMCISDAIGLLGFFVTIPGISQVKCCTSHEARWAKRATKITGGVMYVLAGILGLIPVSYVAHNTVLQYFDQKLPDVIPRWEFGDALFIGWSAGFLHIVAGLLLFASCLDSTRSEPRFLYNHRRHELRTTDTSAKKHSEYV